MRLSKLKQPLCGTDRIIIDDIEIVSRAVPIEDGNGNESTFLEEEWHLKVRPYKADGCRCPVCGKKCKGYDRSDERSWRTVDVGISRCYLHYAPRRVSCEEHGVVTEAVTWADEPKARLTRILDDQIAWSMCHLCQSAVRELMRVGSSTVANACARVLARVVNQQGLLDGVTRIGIDETGWGHHKVMTVVVDHDNNRVIWAGEGVGMAALQPFFDQMGPERCAAVELVSRDGAAWIEAACRENLPNATQVMDPFHAVAWVSDALDEVRQQALRDAREVYNSLPKGKRGRPAKDDPNAKARAVALAKVKEVEGTRWSLLKNPEDLTERQKETLDKVSKANRRLYRAYNLKEGFRDVFSLGPAEGITEDLLKIWLSRACRSKIPEMVKVSRSIRKRKEEILAAVEYGLSNSRLEATNNKIKVAIRMGYGYSNFENLKAIVMLRCCGVKLDLPGRMPTGWRTKGFARRTRSNMKPRKKAVDVKTTA